MKDLVLPNKIEKIRYPAILFISVHLLDENQKEMGSLTSGQYIPARNGRGFEGSEIRVDRTYRQKGDSELKVSFNIKL